MRRYKVLVIFVIIAVFASLVIYVNRQQVPLDTQQPLSPQPSENPDKQDIFAKLTANSWCNKKVTEGSPFPDYIDYRFKDDGTYEWHFFTDYTPAPSDAGKWNFEQTPADDWFLLYDNGMRQRFSLKDGMLMLGSVALDVCDPITVTNQYTSGTLPPIQLTSKVQNIINTITAHPWKRANDIDLDYAPTSVEFKKNWEYITTYRNGECQNSGYWYATASEIQVNSLTDQCDPRDDTYPEAFTAELLDNGFLFFDYELYVPIDYPLQKGIIWSVFGYSDIVNIKVEYDMPIKSGVPNRFDIEMTHVGKKEDYPGPITLQRFSITEDYVRDYRKADNTIAQVDEIAGQDLGSKILRPSETYKFSLDVTFKNPGKQSPYINALMYGPTQDWDTQRAYSINVQSNV